MGAVAGKLSMCADAVATRACQRELMTDDKAVPLRGGVSDQTELWRRASAAVAVGAVLTQAGVLFLTFAAGLQWGGWTYVAAVLQAALAGALVAVLASRRRWLALAVPLTSAALSIALYAFFVEVETAAACTQDIREATGQLAPPPGTRPRFHGEPANGCIARFTVPASATESVYTHYRREFAGNGWELATRDSGPLQATKNGIDMNVEVVEGEGGLVVMEVYHTSDR